ncbi:MAG: hypothetical protein QHJ82_15735 [Verrucomicrobiota bacterium]|nr:hypothetical protein [Verrucomicrobiota bacterium]
MSGVVSVELSPAGLRSEIVYKFFYRADTQSIFHLLYHKVHLSHQVSGLCDFSELQS